MKPTHQVTIPAYTPLRVPFSIPEPGAVKKFRTWQNEAFDALKGSQFRAISASTGSGKSTLGRGLTAWDHRQGQKVIIAVPQRNLQEGSYSHDKVQWPWLDAPANWSGRMTGAYGESTTEAILEFIRRPYRNVLSEDILITTHQALRMARAVTAKEGRVNKVGEPLFWDPQDKISLLLDECHFARGASEDGDDSNVIGQVVDHWVNLGLGPVTLLSATWFRGDCNQIVSQENLSKFQRYTLAMPDYLEQCGGPAEISVRYVYGPSDKVLREVAFEEPRKTMFFAQRPAPGAASLKGDRVKQLLSVFKAKAKEGHSWVGTCEGRPYRVVDIVSEAGRDQVQDELKARINPCKDEAEPDLVMAMDLGKLGFDWPSCDTVIIEGNRSSYADILQRLGRALRAYPGKTKVTFVFSIPSKAPKSGDKVFDHLKLLMSSLVIDAVFRPPSLKTASTPAKKSAASYLMGDPSRLEGILDALLNKVRTPGLTPEEALAEAVQDYSKGDFPAEVLSGEVDRDAFEEAVAGAVSSLADQHLGLLPDDIKADLRIEEGTSGLLFYFLSRVGIQDLREIRKKNQLLDRQVLIRRTQEWAVLNVHNGPYIDENGQKITRMRAIKDGLYYRDFQREFPEAPPYHKLKSAYGQLTQTELFLTPSKVA